MDNSDASEKLEVKMTDIAAEEVTRAINSLTNNKARALTKSQQRCSNTARTHHKTTSRTVQQHLDWMTGKRNNCEAA